MSLYSCGLGILFCPWLKQWALRPWTSRCISWSLLAVVLHGKQILEAGKSYQNTVSANTEQHRSRSLMDQAASGCAQGLKNNFSVEITFMLEL